MKNYTFFALLCIIMGEAGVQDSLTLKKETSFSWRVQARAESIPYAHFRHKQLVQPCCNWRR
jgi:hypothetical protein